MRRPRRSAAPKGGGRGGAKAPLEAQIVVDVKDAAGVLVIALDGKDEAPVQGLPVIDLDGKDEAPVQGVPVVPGVDGKGEAPVQCVPVVPGVDGKGKALVVEGNGEAEEEEEGVKWLKHYSSMQSILVIGDGDLSFSLALATAFGSGKNLVATSLDSYEALKRKYSKAESNIVELKRIGATVLHGVDAKKMKSYTYLKLRRFDRIVFNFPHAGFKGKEDQVHMINSHKELVWGFFGNARHLLWPYGEIHVTHKIGEPYDSWDIKQLASKSFLTMVDKIPFQKEDYPGYNQKRGDSAKCDQPFPLGVSCTFKFCIGDIKKLKQVCRNKISSISFVGGSKVHPGIMATGRRPFDPLPAWPQPHFPPVNTVHTPMTLEPYQLRIAQREPPRFPVNFGGIERDPYFHQQGTIWPMFSTPGPPLNDLPTISGIPPPMSRTTSTSLLAHQEQPLYQERPIAELQRRGEYYYSARDYQRSLQREYEIHRQVMPGGTSLGYSVFLEQRYRESVEKQERLERLIALCLCYNDH